MLSQNFETCHSGYWYVYKGDWRLQTNSHRDKDTGSRQEGYRGQRVSALCSLGHASLPAPVCALGPGASEPSGFIVWGWLTQLWSLASVLTHPGGQDAAGVPALHQ